jgi:hypothetical protein
MLRCLSDYRSNGYGPYVAGEVIQHLTPNDIAFLLADSPGSFEVLSDDEPAPADRMVRKATTRKAAA